LGPLEGTNLNPLTFYKGPNWVGVFSPPHLRTETDELSETPCFYFQNTGRWEKFKNQVILCSVFLYFSQLVSTAIKGIGFEGLTPVDMKC
jgi:hypothetical protein